MAWFEARVLHGHVGVGSVFIADNPTSAGFVGFLHGFDCSFVTNKPPTKNIADATNLPAFNDASVHKEPNAGLEEKTVGGNPSGSSQTC